MQQQLARLGIRWLANSFGIWLAAELFANVQLSEGLGTALVAGLVLALVNAIMRPAMILLSLPAILVTLGLFMVVINGVVVVVADSLYGGISVGDFRSSVLAGAVIGLLNYMVTIILEVREDKRK